MTGKTIFDVLTHYHRSLENMRTWLQERPPESLPADPAEDVERIGLVDAWQEEMKDYFRTHGFCFACNRPVSRCRCEEPL
jgi:hypothetical protein